MKHIRIFIRGLGLTIVPLGAGVFIARYVPSLWIVIASLAMACFLIYLAGATLNWPWRLKP